MTTWHTADVKGSRWVRLKPAHLTLGYAAVGLTWIVVSDTVLAWMRSEPVEMGQIVKGSGFVLVTAALLWLVLRRYMQVLLASHTQYRRSQRQLRTLLSNLPGVAYRCRNDEHYTLLFASEGGRALTGYDLAGEGEGENGAPGVSQFHALIDPRDVETIKRQIAEAVEQDRPFQLTYRIRHADGSVRWVWEQGRAVGDASVLEGFITDITDHMQTQRALEKSEKRHRMLIETAMEGVVIIDRSARVQSANPQMANLLGCTVDELTGRRITDFVEPALKDDVNERLERRWRGEAEQYETRYRRKDGSRIWAIVTTNPIFEEDGRVSGALGMVTDITQRVAAEQKLRDSEQRYRALAASRKLLLNELDHRVKNNLAGLHALLSMYARRAESVGGFAEFMRQQLVAMTTVHEMIASANWEPIRLRDVVHHASSQFRLAEADGRTISLEGPTVTIAPRQAGPLIMVLHELFTNCRKHGAYAEATGHVAVAWEVEDSANGRRHLTLRWAESCGADGDGAEAATEPISPGLGLGLVAGFTQHELGGSFTYERDAEGFRCTLTGILDAPPTPSGEPGADEAEAGYAAPREKEQA